MAVVPQGAHRRFRFDLTDLQLFLNVTEAGTITAGARKTHLTLASASERIRELEENAGVTLLVRERTGVRPTPAGALLVEHARSVLARVEHMQEDLTGYASGLKGHVRLLCNTSALSEHLPDALADFLVEHPNVSIELEEKTSGEIVDAVRMGKCDIGVAADSVDLSGIEVHRVRPDPLVMIAPPAHPLAARRTVRLADLVEHGFVGLAEQVSLEKLIAEHARRLGRRLDYRARVRDFDTVCRMVGAGVGIGIVPQAAARRYRKLAGIRITPIDDAWARERNSLLCVRSLDALPAFARALAQRILGT